MNPAFQPLPRGRMAARARSRFAGMAVLVSLASCVDASGSVSGGNGAGPPLDAAPAETGPDAGPLQAAQKPRQGGKFYENGFTSGCPEMMVRAGDFCIDRFEAYVVELKDGREVPHPHSLPPKGKVLRAKVAYNEFPQSSITLPDAEQACFNAEKRLCTLQEWVKACSGVESFKYPYGNEEARGKCNTRKPPIRAELHGLDPTGAGMKDPMLNYIPGFLSRSGLYGACVSGYGAYDMVGNLHEWVSTLVDDSLAKRPVLKADPRFKTVPGNGIFMGGFYGTGNQNGEGCRYMTTVHGPDQDDYSVGFRCCKDAGD